MTGLDALARVTGLDILSYIIVHSRPVEHLVDGCVGSFDALVSCNGGVMMVMEDLGSEFSLGNAQAILIIVKVALLIFRVVFEE